MNDHPAASPACLCRENPHRLVSLLDMLRNYGFELFGFGQYLTVEDLSDSLPRAIYRRLLRPWTCLDLLRQRRKHGHVKKESFHLWIEMIIRFCDDCGLRQSRAYLSEGLRLRRLQSGFEENEANHFTHLFTNELREVYFMYVSGKLAQMYNDPLGFFGDKVAVAFPSATTDMEESCRCLAVDRATACVFHSMRVAEKGLHALAHEMEIASDIPVSLMDWHNIIDQIEAQIKRIQAQPKSARKRDDLRVYSEAAVQFRYFKDAWRNHVSHSRMIYDSNQADSVLHHVRDFMQALTEYELAESP